MASILEKLILEERWSTLGSTPSLVYSMVFHLLVLLSLMMVPSQASTPLVSPSFISLELAASADYPRDSQYGSEVRLKSAPDKISLPTPSSISNPIQTKSESLPVPTPTQSTNNSRPAGPIDKHISKMNLTKGPPVSGDLKIGIDPAVTTDDSDNIALPTVLPSSPQNDSTDAGQTALPTTIAAVCGSGAPTISDSNADSLNQPLPGGIPVAELGTGTIMAPPSNTDAVPPLPEQTLPVDRLLAYSTYLLPDHFAGTQEANDPAYSRIIKRAGGLFERAQKYHENNDVDNEREHLIETIRILNFVLALLQRDSGSGSVESADSLIVMGQAYSQLSNHKSSAYYLDKAVHVYSETKGEESDEWSFAVIAYAKELIALNNYTAAAQQLETGMKRWKDSPQHIGAAQVAQSLLRAVNAKKLLGELEQQNQPAMSN